MPRTTPPERSLAAVRADLVAELDVSRHPNIDLWRLAAGSHQKLWWRCENGHDWQAVVKNRVRLGSGCPRCADERRWLVAPERSLAARFPELAAELDRRRNGDLDPWTLPPATLREVWWRGCPHGHPPWRARPWYRTRGAGCPYCAGALPLPERSLAAHPELVAELDPDRNGDLNPHEIAARGIRRLWWRCHEGHVWQARVSRRLNGSQCPYCSGHQVTPERSLAAHPDLVSELDPDTTATSTPPASPPAATDASGGAAPRGTSGKPWSRPVSRSAPDAPPARTAADAAYHSPKNGRISSTNGSITSTAARPTT
jgi:hypothetical protein